MDILTVLLFIASGAFVMYVSKLTIVLWETNRKSGILNFAKYVTSFFYFAVLRQRRRRIMDLSPYGKTTQSMGFLATNSEIDLELPRKICSKTVGSTDGVTFTGTDKSGSLLIVRLVRRPNREAEVWLSLRLPDGRIFSLPQHPDTISNTTDSNSFSSNCGLLIECLDPMRHWRIAYNGLLRKGVRTNVNSNDNHVVHARFSLRWRPLSIGVDYLRDIHPLLMTQAIEQDGLSHLISLEDKLRYSHMDQHDQHGMFAGRIAIDNEDQLNLVLRGLKSRHIDFCDWALLNNSVEVSGYCQNGDVIKLGVSNFSNGFSQIQYGFICKSKIVTFNIKESTLDFNMASKLESTGQVTLNLSTEEETYTCSISLEDTKFLFNVGEFSEVNVNVYPMTFKLNGITGYGLARFDHKNHTASQIERPRKHPIIPEVDPEGHMNLPLLVDLSEQKCQLSSLVGGKGSSLAKLFSMQQHKFLVPFGFCLTTEAYWDHLNTNPGLKREIEKLCIATSKNENVKEESKRTVELFENTPLSAETVKAISEKLWKLYGPKTKELLFAVRSSAVGEDSADLSAAGQNETILGVKGEKEIERAIRKCWGSQFAYQALQYRRQYGQPIDCAMSVVVQEMEHCEVAGVMFTREPATGNPGIITITANYGLGESVVSASAEPDTIEVRRTWDDQLSIKEKQLGAKATKIQLKDEGGTEEVSISQNETEKCCLSDDMIIRIARIGVMVEQAFGDSRDIEFGITNNEIYMLQARPITSLHPESDQDLEEEMDSPHLTDHEYSSTANVGEVFPGSLKHLSYSSSLMAFFIYMQRDRYMKYTKKEFVYQTYVTSGWRLRYGHMLGSFAESLSTFNSGMTKESNDAWECSLFGCVKNLTELYAMTRERFDKPSLYSKLYDIYKKYKIIFTNKQNTLKNGMEKFFSCNVPVDGAVSSRDCLNTIEEYTIKFIEIGHVHLDCSMATNHLNGWLMQLLPSDSGVDLFSNLSNLLSSCSGVVSADVPQSLEKLALTISRDQNAKDFMNMDAKDAFKWLQEHDGDAGKEFAEFLDNHGHRCICEFELYATAWALDPVPVVQNLQNMTKHASILYPNKKILTSEEAIATLNVPLSTKNRIWLKLILPYARSAVGYREQSKSLYIRTVHHLRVAYRKLGQMMVDEGRIPDLELVFFLTLWELRTLLETRSPKLVSKAIRRRRVDKGLEDIKFPEICVGIPKRIQQEDCANESIIKGSKVTGTPVSQGSIKATARVIKSVKEADQIQPGEILITFGTDIAWSPYFPLLSGVVTEMGGLISHGAVVAREYGLPCIVNAKTATSIFKSGDQVILNATKGYIEKVEVKSD